ncbi:MAG: hypothetical protein P4N41_01945 [Negativicutes bacterium]|nr:hypothetical protein [Negativicutes bacterium]
MPAQVIAFPSNNEQPLSENERILTDVDKLIRLTLTSMNLDEHLINHVAERIKDYVEKYASITFNCKFDLAVPQHTSPEEKAVMKNCLDKGIEALATQVQGMVNKIIMERVMLEIKIYEDQKAYETLKASEKPIKLVQHSQK